MASTKIPQKQDELVSLAEDAADGVSAIGGEIGLAHTSEAEIRGDLAALMGDTESEPPVVGTEELYNDGKSRKVAKHKAEADAEKAGRDFIGYTKDALYKTLGRQWNSAWNAVGFTDGTLKIPSDPLPMLLTIRGYFAVNQDSQNLPLNVTAEEANRLTQVISAARSEANMAKVNLAAAKDARDEDKDTLYHRMTGLRSELDQLLEDDDPRWYAFGLPRPADGDGPGPISTLDLTLGSEGMVVADWSRSIRVDRYRVFKQIVGMDAEPVQVASDVEGLSYTLTELPSGETVEIHIVPVNEAGDGPSSPFVSAVVP